MRQNLGKLDRIFRFVLGLVLLCPYAPRFYIPWLNLLRAAIGLWVLLESFVGYCWLHDLFGINNKNQ